MLQTLGAGFALAAGPVSASTITTSADDLEAGDVSITAASGSIPAYQARPKKSARKLPVLLVVHEIFGVHEHIRDVCRRLAHAGFFAIAPDLFTRQGDPRSFTDTKELQSKLVSKVPDAQVLSDLDETLAFARRDPSVDPGRAAITGFCWGGRIVWLYAAHNPHLNAAVAWYGRLIGDRGELRPRFPMDVVDDLKAPVLGLYGGQDTAIPAETVDAMRTLLRASKTQAAQRSELVVYPQAGHAFFADYRPSYRKDAAEDGWKRLLDWLKRHRAA